MVRSANIFKSVILLPLFLGIAPANAQLFHDTSTLNLVKKEIDYIYNLQFDDTRRLYITISKRYPEHPIIFLLKGFKTYWENYPLLYSTPAGVSFEEDMNQCIKFSEKDNNPDYATEYLLTNLCARGMLLLYFTENEQSMKVFPLTISTYRFLQRSFDVASSCVDLYYFTGIFNYYREAYPRIYPVYKPLVLLFPEGNEEKGLNDLLRAATSSVVLQAESYFMLSWIYLRFENTTDALINH